jgi:hypothetical protein
LKEAKGKKEVKEGSERSEASEARKKVKRKKEGRKLRERMEVKEEYERRQEGKMLKGRKEECTGRNNGRHGGESSLPLPACHYPLRSLPSSLQGGRTTTARPLGMGVGRSDAMNLDWGEGSNVRWLVVGRDAKAQVTFSLDTENLPQKASY